MDDTLLLYRNAKPSDTTAVNTDTGTSYTLYSAKIFDSGIRGVNTATATYMQSIGLINGDRMLAKDISGAYRLLELDSTATYGVKNAVVSLTDLSVYCEADLCYYRFLAKQIDGDWVYMYEIYQPAVPFYFHNTSEQIYLKDFTYTAERMGKTPTLTADFYDKECYDNIWDNDTTDPKYRFSDIFTIFRGERYYFKLTPQSQLQNTDERYKHTINFVSEREKLEHAKMFDVVTTSTPDAPVSDSSKFVFYGTLSEFADRINASLIKEGVTFATTHNDTTIYSGYHVVIDDDVTEEQRTTAATVSIENNSILQALDHLDTDYGVSYYVVGYEIHIGDKQADLTGTGHPALEYGADDSLIQITRQNVTKDIITRITGYGSEDNIPYYYPNPCESGFLQAIYDQRTGSSGYVKHPYEYTKINNAVTKAIPLLSITNEPIYPNTGDKYYNSSDRKIYTYNGTAWADGAYAVYGDAYTFGGKIYMRRSTADTNYGRTLIDKSSEYNKFLKNARGDYFEYGRPYNVYPTIDPTIYTDPNTQQKYRIILYEISMDEAVQLYARFSSNRYSPNSGSSLLETTSNTGSAESELFALHDISFNTNHVLVKIRQNVGYEFVNGYRYESSTIPVYNNGHGDVNVNFPEAFYSESGLYRACTARREFIFDWMVEDKDIGESITLGTSPMSPSGQPWHDRFVYCDQVTTGVYNVGRWYARWNWHNGYWEWGQGTKITPQTNKCYRDIPTGKIYRWNGSSYVYVATQASSSPASLSNLPHLIVYRKVWYRNTNTGIPQKLFAGDDITQYGLAVNGTPVRGDKITFDTAYYMQPQQYLMPSIYYNSNGQRRFFDAIQYPYSRVRGKSIDYEIGEYVRHFIAGGYKVANLNYASDNSGDVYYEFENIIDKGHPRTHVEQISDIKPSIEGMTVTVSGQTIRADIFEDFCYDDLDCDDTWDAYEREAAGDDTLNLKHPHFFAKLRPLGFNLFDMAIDEAEMVVNFNTGCCMACSFKIKVGKDTMQNVIALFDTDVYRENDNGVMALWHTAGTPMRYSDRPLYSDINGTTEIPSIPPPQGRGNDDDDAIKYDGDVITSDVHLDNVQESQLDTTSNYVWIALEKDINTFSYPMPSVVNNMKPNSYTDTSSENTADKFVFTHIKMPLQFVRSAEERLSKALVEYMDKNNAELFHYSIKFSRIFLSESTNTYADDLNENVKLHILYADHSEKSFYVKSYTYKKVAKEPLPEISVELRENINVVRYRYANRIDIHRWDEIEEWNRRAEPVLRDLMGNGNGNGSSVVNGNMVANLSRHLVSRNGSTLRGVLMATDMAKIVGNLGIIRSNGQQVSVNEIDNILGIDEEKGVRGKAKNLLTDLGILEFDETRSYEVDEMVVHNNRLMRFTQKKTAGIWDDTKAVNDSVSNCIFRALGVQEYDAEKTTKYNVGDKFFRNNKVYNVTTEFTPKVGSTYVTETVFANSTRKMDIIANFTEKDDTTTLRRTVDDVSRVINNLNEQVLNADSGIAIVMENVNKKLADLTSAMATENAYTRQYVAALADALKENEFLAQDSNVTAAAGNVSDYMTQTSAVTTAATAANTELTGADVESAYNKLINFIAEVQFGQLVKDVHSTGGATDSTYTITHKIYETSQYMVGVPVEFNMDEAYDANQMVIHLKHLYQLTAGKAAGADWGDIDPSTISNMDDILKKIVVFSTDAYDITSGSDFLEYGMYTMAAAFCEWVQKFISDYGDKGLLYSDLDDLVIKETADYKDGDGYNMFAEHTAYASSQTKVYYTVLQYAILRMERNGVIYAASTYTKELIKDDDKHIIFNVKTIQNMGVEVTKMMEGCPTKSVVVGGEEKLCYYISIADMAGKFGYNYLYAADYLVENETMYYDSVEKEYYLPVE